MGQGGGGLGSVVRWLKKSDWLLFRGTGLCDYKEKRGRVGETVGSRRGGGAFAWGDRVTVIQDTLAGLKVWGWLAKGLRGGDFLRWGKRRLGFPNCERRGLRAQGMSEILSCPLGELHWVVIHVLPFKMFKGER